ncbi:MAG: 5'-3' exonuclease H3TH domain-containing protein, partial [Pseudomonadota bacterium]
MSDGGAIGPESHVYLVDGSGFIFRAYHALPALTRKSDGAPVGAVSGFCNMLWKMLSEMTDDDRPTHFAVIFDKGKTSFRNEIFDGYKAQRPEPPEDLRPQFAMIRDATRAFGLPCIEVENYEADDLIATYARRAQALGAEVTIVSSDKDLMQLVAERVEMLDPMKDRRIGAPEVIEKFGVGPERVIDVQALAGDSVDNVPGAPGIGVKTAAQLITAFGDLDALLAGAETIKQPKRRQTLIDHADQIRLSRRLVTLDVDAPTPEPLEAFALGPTDGPKLIAYLKGMEFRTLTRRIADALDVDPGAVSAATPGAAASAAPKASAPSPRPNAAAPALAPPPSVAADALPFDPARYEIIRDQAALDRWIAWIRERGAVAIDTETTSLDEMRAELVGVCLCVEPGTAAYLPIGHKLRREAAEGDLFDDGGAPERAPGQMPREAALAALKPMLEDPSILKIGQNLKYDMKVLARAGIDLAPIDDTMLI